MKRYISKGKPVNQFTTPKGMHNLSCQIFLYCCCGMIMDQKRFVDFIEDLVTLVINLAIVQNHLEKQYH